MAKGYSKDDSRHKNVIGMMRDELAEKSFQSLFC